MKIKYLGHSAVLIENTDFKGLIDPFLTGNPLYKKCYSDIENISHIFITHGHGDHIGDSIDIALKNKSVIICNFEIGEFLLAEFPSINVHKMHIGGRYKFSFGTVKMTPALHGSGISHGGSIIYGGNPCGFLIERNGIKIYHSGDTGLTYDMKLLESENIDLAFLPIGGNFTMDIQDASKAVKFIKPKKIVPLHYNTFDIINADPQIFKENLPDENVLVMDPGDWITI